MTMAIETWERVVTFMEAGGDVLYIIFAVTTGMWLLISERLMYFFGAAERECDDFVRGWQAREDRSSWNAHQIRRRLVSLMGQRLRRSLPMIKTMVAVCPLLGLFGTVTGMVELFEVMAISGTSNAKAMASGISQATISTMAGLVAALSGMYLSIQLGRFANSRQSQFESRLELEEEHA